MGNERLKMKDPYINDEHHAAYGDRAKATATHLRELSRRLALAADSAGSLGVDKHEDICLETQVLAYIKQNYGKIGDISMAHGLVKLVRTGSQYYRG
jgi:hypothetical protein